MRSAWTRLGAACIASCLALGIYLWVSSRPYVPPLYVHSKDAKLAMSGNAPTPKMYYVAMCAGEYDIASLVEEELLTHHSVHKIIYVETAYNFRDGSPKKLHNCSGRSKYPGRVSTHVAYVEEEDRAMCDQAAWAESQNKGSASVFRSKASYCYDNMGKNEEARAFELAGGGAHDIAVLADVDEIPDTAALAQLRTWPPDHGVSVKLQAIHHYKYNLGCERSGLPADQLHHRGPVAVLGQTLFDVGASAARDAVANGPVCFEAGYRASCTPLRERRIARSSWHMSSVDGGEDVRCRACALWRTRVTAEAPRVNAGKLRETGADVPAEGQARRREAGRRGDAPARPPGAPRRRRDRAPRYRPRTDRSHRLPPGAPQLRGRAGEGENGDPVLEDRIRAEQRAQVPRRPARARSRASRRPAPVHAR